jgi:hypothetical protein
MPGKNKQIFWQKLSWQCLHFSQLPIKNNKAAGVAALLLKFGSIVTKLLSLGNIQYITCHRLLLAGVRNALSGI